MNPSHNWILHGDKVTLQRFTELDINSAYLRWLNDSRVVRFSNQRFRKHDNASSLAYLYSFSGTDNIFVLARKKDTGQPLGTLTVYIATPHGTADIGIMIGEASAWGQGIGQDAWNTLIEWVAKQPGIRKITAGALAGNLGMVRIMSRSGMQLEAVRRAQEIVEGQPQDILYYARFTGD